MHNGGQLSPGMAPEIYLDIARLYKNKSTLLKFLENQFKLVVLLILLGNRLANDNFLKIFPEFFSTMEDVLWFKLTCTHENKINGRNNDSGSIRDLQHYSNNFKSEYYNRHGIKSFVYVKVLLICQRIHSALSYMCLFRDPFFNITGL